MTASTSRWLTWEERRQLRGIGLGHVDDMVGTGAAHVPDLTHDPGLETVAAEIRMGERVAGVRIDRTGCGLTDGEVVRVAGAGDALPPAQGRRCQDPIGSEPADRPGDVAAQVDGRGEGAIGVAVEKRDIEHAQRGGGRALFGLAQSRHRLPRGVVEPARVAPGDEQVSDVEAVGHPLRDGARRAEVHVVRVGEDA
jgi:hypothetical protein